VSSCRSPLFFAPAWQVLSPLLSSRVPGPDSGKGGCSSKQIETAPRKRSFRIASVKWKKPNSQRNHQGEILSLRLKRFFYDTPLAKVLGTLKTGRWERGRILSPKKLLSFWKTRRESLCSENALRRVCRHMRAGKGKDRRIRKTAYLGL